MEREGTCACTSTKSNHLKCITYITGLHLEIDPRGSEMNICGKEGGQSPVYMCISTCTLGGSGDMFPQKIFDFRWSETASGAFSGTL